MFLQHGIIFLSQNPTGVLIRERVAPYYDHSTQYVHEIWSRIACFVFPMGVY